MSESFICRRGGSGTPFAVIGVTYPEGSTCTCSDGTKTLTAKGTSGRAIFNIPYAGTWTVSCTDGTDTASESVSITADGQSETVELNYGTYLIDYEEYPNYDTWSWKNYPVNNNDPNPSRVSVTRGESGLTIPGGSGFNNFYGTDNIDLTSFTTLHIAFSITKATGWGGYLGVLSGTTSRFDGNFLASISISSSLVGNNLTRSIDISSVTGSHKIGVGYYGGLDIVLHQVWLT